MIPAEFKDEVISTGISFLRSITNAFGQEAGLELWDTISSTLDPDVKGQIFFAMICGQESRSITIIGINSNVNKIQIVKSIRTVTGFGLKEAKDIADTFVLGKGAGNTLLYSFGKPVTIKICNSLSRDAAVHELKTAGCLI